MVCYAAGANWYTHLVWEGVGHRCRNTAWCWHTQWEHLEGRTEFCRKIKRAAVREDFLEKKKNDHMFVQGEQVGEDHQTKENMSKSMKSWKGMRFGEEQGTSGSSRTCKGQGWIQVEPPAKKQLTGRRQLQEIWQGARMGGFKTRTGRAGGIRGKHSGSTRPTQLLEFL